MDLVHPDDQSLAMSMWNKLAQGTPVTFEMRWKSHAESNDLAQRVCSSQHSKLFVRHLADF